MLCYWQGAVLSIAVVLLNNGSRSWEIILLWQLHTLWILVKLHEAVPYVELAQAAFVESCNKQGGK